MEKNILQKKKKLVLAKSVPIKPNLGQMLPNSGYCYRYTFVNFPEFGNAAEFRRPGKEMDFREVDDGPRDRVLLLRIPERLANLARE